MADIQPLASLPSLNDVGNFIYGGNTNLTLEQIKRRQAVAAALAGQRRAYPNNVGQGLTYLGEKIGDRLQEARLRTAEDDYNKRFLSAIPTQPGGGLVGGSNQTSAPNTFLGRPVTPVQTRPGATSVPPSLLNPNPGVPISAPATAATAVNPPATTVKGYTSEATSDDERRAEAPQGDDANRDIAVAPEDVEQVAQATDSPSPAASAQRDRIALASLQNSLPTSQGVAQSNPTLGAAILPPTLTPASGSRLEGSWVDRANAIGGIESGGRKNPYQTVGVETRGDRPYGRYGIMGANIPIWTQAALGRPMTPAEFLADPAAQDATFQHRFGQYVDKYGEAGAARAWFGGQRNMNNLRSTDNLGTSIGSYEQQYLNRLRGGPRTSAELQNDDRQLPQYAALDTGTMSDAPPLGAGYRPVNVPDENPETPTDIKPMPVQLAQATIPGQQATGIPGPLTPATPIPQTPTSPRPGAIQLPDNFLGPLVKPVLPTPAPLQPDELKAYDLLRQFPDDPRAQLIARQLQGFGQAQREAIDKRNIEVYQGDLRTYEERVKKREAFQLAEPERTETMNKAVEERRKLEDERADRERTQQQQNQMGGLTSQQYVDSVIKPSQENTKGLSGGTRSIALARQLLDQGIYSGAGATYKMGLERATGSLPFMSTDPKVARTQEFLINTGPLMAAARPGLVGNANISDRDMEIVQRMALGDITLEPEAMRRGLDIIEKNNLDTAVQHQKKLAVYGGNDANRIGFAYNGFGLPMESIIPKSYADALRTKVQAAGSDQKQVKALMDRFDQNFATPGVAARLLGGG